MFTDTERMLMIALIVSALVQVAKLFVPLLNGWGAVAANLGLSAVGVIVLFNSTLTWTTVATFLLIALASAGIHGTATKISDHPSPHDNPTPSGTPAQNFDRLEL